MDSLEALVKRHIKEFPDFQYYGAFAEFISAIETYHQYLHMGVSLDCCNSLLQSICKTIIIEIDPRIDLETLDTGSKSTTNSLISNPHSALQLLRHVLVTKTRQFNDTTNRNSLTAAT